MLPNAESSNGPDQSVAAGVVRRAPPPPIAPPTSPGQLSLAHLEPSWPGVLGIMCLVYGVLIALVAIMSLAAPLFMLGLAQVMPPEQSATMGLTQSPRSIALSSMYYVPALFINVWLSVLGYKLYKMSPTAPARLRLWSLIKIGIEIVGAAVTFLVTLDAMRVQQEVLAKQMATAGGATPPPAFLTSNWFVYGTATWGTLWSLLLGLAMPLFLLIWFRRRSVREYIATWRTRAQTRAQ